MGMGKYKQVRKRKKGMTFFGQAKLIVNIHVAKAK
jgi:hypothetical protein